ncbi:Protein of unknown function [Cotesia congregata]|uniref:Uncharacterized protein n=1 Tax=Cotesia congregata TaxID=51543 RepID=A0A8J2E835_COTCN|nr:Protein of unknown function [Cotesia congregata]
MGKNRRSGYRYYIKQVHSDFMMGKVHHRPLIETKYWEEDLEPAKTTKRRRFNEKLRNSTTSTNSQNNNNHKSHGSSEKSDDRPTTSGNKTVGDDVGNHRFGPPFIAYDPPTFEEAEDLFAERHHRPKLSSPEIKIKFSISGNGLTYAQDHLVHFLAADCEIIKPVAKLLRDLKFINADDLHASKPSKGDVFVTKLGRCKIFTDCIH